MWHQEAVLVALQTTGLVYMYITDNTKNKLVVRIPQSGSSTPFSVWFTVRELVSSYTFFLL